MPVATGGSSLNHGTMHFIDSFRDWKHIILGWENESIQITTPRMFNIGPEKKLSQKESSLPTIILQGQAVKLRGCMEYTISHVSLPLGFQINVGYPIEAANLPPL